MSAGCNLPYRRTFSADILARCPPIGDFYLKINVNSHLLRAALCCIYVPYRLAVSYVPSRTTWPCIAKLAALITIVLGLKGAIDP
jgi:hypothetical protein